MASPFALANFDQNCQQILLRCTLVGHRTYREFDSLLSGSGFRSFLSKTPAPRRRLTSRFPSSSSTDDPSSPRVGCMGQIRQCEAMVPQAPAHGTHVAVPSAAFLSNQSFSAGLKKPVRNARTASGRRGKGRMGSRVVALEEIDPPLPVAKKDMGTQKPADSLWTRRCAGRELEKLTLCRQARIPEVVAIVKA
ncbi:hypothetical protein HPP92_018620 [Vanilla planifolia]|uniref:Uncharacterized protein n=1 Tax=Vanilla planifolia TaxID=51239 RepID=A0A835QHX3_VANPL|nr:hypothetical protein HPP92_018620 [Vanilla planifolia]